MSYQHCFHVSPRMSGNKSGQTCCQVRGNILYINEICYSYGVWVGIYELIYSVKFALLLYILSYDV